MERGFYGTTHRAMAFKQDHRTASLFISSGSFVPFLQWTQSRVRRSVPGPSDAMAVFFFLLCCGCAEALQFAPRETHAHTIDGFDLHHVYEYSPARPHHVLKHSTKHAQEYSAGPLPPTFDRCPLAPPSLAPQLLSNSRALVCRDAAADFTRAEE